MMTFFLFILAIGILVVTHELGHFCAAKISGVRVDEFGIGFPPTLWSKKFGETVYSINWIPFGGFVKIAGEDGEEAIEGLTLGIKKVKPSMTENLFSSKPVYTRIFILAAGVLSNLLTAYLLLVFVIAGRQSMGGLSVDRPVMRDNIYIEALKEEYTLTNETITGLGYFVTHLFSAQSSITEVSGPVGIFSIIGQAANRGVDYFLFLMALLSINLAVLNVLPIPALDGGRMFFIILESLRGKAFTPKVTERVNNIGFNLLIILMLAVTVSDLLKLFK